MTHNLKLPLAMGAMMGIMMPFMIHAAPELGLAFVLAHLAVAGLAIAGALLAVRSQRLARWVARMPMHRPNLRHVAGMASGAVFGFALVCTYCLMIGGDHPWT